MQNHDYIPKPQSRSLRGGEFVDALRSLDNRPHGHSVSFPVGERSAVYLRNALWRAAVALNVKIQTVTADGRVYAALRKENRNASSSKRKKSYQ